MYLVIFILVVSVLTVIAIFTAYFIHVKKKRKIIIEPIPQVYREILAEHVDFYQNLSIEKRKEFEQRIEIFLANTRITGVKTEVEDIDKVLISSSAVIPIFGFPNWEYINLKEVLLYPDHFNHEFEQQGHDRNILGMVGDGPLNRTMILSKQELRNAFANKEDGSNVGIHEFVHLLDKTDGAVDGLPEFLLHRQYAKPWLQLMQKEIDNIINDKSNLNPYGATNEAEFFAVASEYFFEKPLKLKEEHPELYELLEKIFNQPLAAPGHFK